LLPWFALSPGQTGNVRRPNTIKRCLVSKHFTVWTPCLVLFDRVWSCLIKFEGHQIFDQKPNVFGGRWFVRLDSRVSNMFDAGIRAMLAQRLVSIV